MIPEAREVHLSRKDRKVLEACCRSPVTLQRDLKRARIVLLAAAGRSTRSIAKEVGVQPRIVSLWRRRYADHGLEGLQDKPRPGKQPIYTKATDKRILKLLDKPPPAGFARWTGPCWPGRWAMLMSNMSGGSCAITRSTLWFESPGARATTRTLRPRPPMSLASMSPHPARPLCCAWTKSFDPGFGASAGLSEVTQWPRLDRPEPRLQAAWYDNAVCGARSRHRKDHRDAFKTPSPRRVFSTS